MFSTPMKSKCVSGIYFKFINYRPSKQSPDEIMDVFSMIQARLGIPAFQSRSFVFSFLQFLLSIYPFYVSSLI